MKKLSLLSASCILALFLASCGGGSGSVGGGGGDLLPIPTAMVFSTAGSYYVLKAPKALLATRVPTLTATAAETPTKTSTMTTTV